MNSKKENHKSNSDILVPAKLWRQAHPFNLDCQSDSYYSRLATRLTGTIRRMLGDKKELAYTDSDVIDIAVTLAAYLEDKVTGTNVFNAFRALYAERFGGVMPFYEADPELIFDDEPNEVEVRFLVWQTVDRINPDTIIDPLAEPVRLMATELFDILADEYETAPDSPELFDWLFVSADYADPNKMRDRCRWITEGCYLTHIHDIDRVYDMVTNDLPDKFRELPARPTLYLLTVNSAISAQCGPMSLTAPQWLAKIIEMSGRPDLPADKIKAIDYRTHSRYLISRVSESTDDDATFTVVDMTGRELHVSFNMLPAENRHFLIEGNCIDMALFSYDGVWHLNGLMDIRHDHSDYNKISEEYRRQKQESADKLLAMIHNNGGSPAGVAPDWQRLCEILGEDSNKAAHGTPSRIVDGKDFLFFINSNGDVSLIPDFALCTALEGNDKYDPATATDNAALLVVNNAYTREMSDYLIEHSMLPDARLETSAMPDDEAKAWFAANARFLSAICHTDCIDPHYA